MKAISFTLWLALCGLVLSFAGCKTTQVNLDKVDRNKPTEVATAVLRAYAAQDLTTLQALASQQHERTLKRHAYDPLPTDVAVSPLFRGAIWEAAQRWDGKIQEVRFSSDLQHAYALFERSTVSSSDLHSPKGRPQTDTPACYVVVLRLERAAWRLDDMAAYTPEAYAALSYVMEQE